jgi:hypothetical protein
MNCDERLGHHIGIRGVHNPGDQPRTATAWTKGPSAKTGESRAQPEGAFCPEGSARTAAADSATRATIALESTTSARWVPEGSADHELTI